MVFRDQHITFHKEHTQTIQKTSNLQFKFVSAQTVSHMGRRPKQSNLHQIWSKKHQIFQKKHDFLVNLEHNRISSIGQPQG